MPAQVDQVALADRAVPARGLDLARGPALDHPVRVALAVHLVPAAHRRPVKHRVRSGPLPAEAAAVARSTPRPKKAQ
jgi:hypothetical protein